MIRLIAAIFLCLGQLYLAGLWLYAAVRTGFGFAWVFVASALLFLFFGVVNLAFALAGSLLHQILGSQFTNVFNLVLAAQPFAILVGALAHTLVVVWLLRLPNRT